MQTHIRAFLFKSLAICLAIGVIAGLISMLIAWEHNPQCAFHCVERGTNFPALLMIGFVWAVVAFALSYVIGGLLPALLKAAHNRAARRHA